MLPRKYTSCCEKKMNSKESQSNLAFHGFDEKHYEDINGKFLAMPIRPLFLIWPMGSSEKSLDTGNNKLGSSLFLVSRSCSFPSVKYMSLISYFFHKVEPS